MHNRVKKHRWIGLSENHTSRAHE